LGKQGGVMTNLMTRLSSSIERFLKSYLSSSGVESLRRR
jgi:hypothetical protein